jgi:hypothetical protein
MVSGHSSWKQAARTITREPSTPTTRAQLLFSFFESYYVDDTAFILLSRGEGDRSPPPSLSSLTFDVLVLLFKLKKQRPFTFQGLDRNHRLLIRRTSKATTTALWPSASSSNTLDPASCLNSMTRGQTSLNGSARRDSYSAPRTSNYSATKRYRSISIANSIKRLLSI